MRPDREIRNDVEAELRWVPDVDESDVTVAVADGIVTLSGFVPHHLDRLHAENAARRVIGCTGVANEIHVRCKATEGRTDAELARVAVDAITVDLPDLADSVQVIVSDGHVRLEGAVDWHWQRARSDQSCYHSKKVDTVCEYSSWRVNAC